MQDLPFASAQMKIRKPVSEVFNAFIDPEITQNFWFTKSSGKLEAGKKVVWEWDMYGISIPVQVVEIVPDSKISILWDEPSTNVDFHFRTLADDATYVEIFHSGFSQKGDELLAVIRDSTGGFTTVVDGLKCWLEHGISLNLILDKFPKKAGSHGKSE